MPRFPSAFSKSIGFTLCGMMLDPTSPLTSYSWKYPFDMYCQRSWHMPSDTVLKWPTF